MKSIHGLVLMFVVVFWGDVNGQIISPFQVSIRLIDNFLPNAGSEKICNGAVIHESFVSTTADCMLVRIRSANISRPHTPSTLYIAPGAFRNSPSDTRFVDSIFIHPQFNPHTLENDIALVKVTEPFPLRNNIAIQWIELDDKNARYENCFYSFQNQTSINYPYNSPQPAYVLDSWYCSQNVNGTNSTQRTNDISSHYALNDSSMCNLQPLQFQVSSDRGTPLVCNNHLSGLLSQIFPPQNVSNPVASCETTLKTWAIYTKVSNYIQWIHQTIASAQPTPVPGQTPQPDTTSPPYYTPAQNHPEKQPSTEKPKGSGANCITKSLMNVVVFFCINLILILSR